MRAQARVRERYVVIRFTHQQLLSLDQRLHLDRAPDTKATEIIGLAARAVIQGLRGNLTRAGMLYDYEVTDAEKAVKKGP